jgi:hypothetical protein
MHNIQDFYYMALRKLRTILGLLTCNHIRNIAMYSPVRKSLVPAMVQVPVRRADNLTTFMCRLS